MTKVNGYTRCLLLGSALVVLIAAGVGCTSETQPKGKSTGSPSAQGAATTPIITPEMPQYLQAVNDANVAIPNTLVAITARPTATEQNSQAIAMVIRDEGREPWKAGNYRLVVYCAGTGTLYAHFRLGAVSQISELPPCTPTVTTGAIDISLPADAVGSSVLIIPAGNAQAGVAYQIQRM